MPDPTLVFDHVGLVVASIETEASRLADLLHLTRWTERFDDHVLGVSVCFATDRAGFVVELIYERQQIHHVQLVRLDRAGHEIDTVGEPGQIEQGRLSPSGLRLAFGVTDPRNDHEDLWIHDLARKVTMRFTGEKGSAFAPIWSPDETRVVFSADWDAIPHLFIRPVASPQATPLLAPTGNVQLATDWSPDGRFILYMERHPTNDFDVWALPLEGRKTPISLAATKFYEGEATFSPDGRWIAYVSDESGNREVYVQPFPGGGERKLISTGGGDAPAWRIDGRELIYLADQSVMGVPMALGDHLTAGTPAALFRLAADERGFGVFADAQHFLAARAVGADETRFPVAVMNWADALAK